MTPVAVGDWQEWKTQSAERTSSGSAPALSASPTVTCYWSFKTVWKASVVVLSRYRFIFELYAKSIHSFSLGRFRVGYPSALMRVVALMAFFCSIHSFLCKCGDRMERLDRHLTSEWCNTFSMAKTSGKAQCAPYYKNTITYTSVYYYYKSLPSKSLTITFMWRLHFEGCTLEDLYSLLQCYYYYYYYYYYFYFYYSYYYYCYCYYYYYHYYYYYYYSYYYLLL